MYRLFWSKVKVVQGGAEPLTHCDLCGNHMSSGWFIKHRRTARCDRNMKMRWRRREVAIANKCTEATFGLAGGDGA